MRLYTREVRASEAPASWGNTYVNYKGSDIQKKDEKTTKLMDLGKNATADEVEQIIGNDSWTRTYCQNCHTKNADTVQFFHYDKDFCLCEKCLKEALGLLKDI